MCALSRYLLVGGLVGMAVSSLTGSDLLAWVAALGAAVLFHLVLRRFPWLQGSCATPGPPVDHQRADKPGTVDVGLGPVTQPDLDSLRHPDRVRT